MHGADKIFEPQILQIKTPLLLADSVTGINHLGKKRCPPRCAISEAIQLILLVVTLYTRGVTRRCRLSQLTNIAPRFMSPNAGGCGVSANENSCAHHVTWSPNKLWRSIFNLCTIPTLPYQRDAELQYSILAQSSLSLSLSPFVYDAIPGPAPFRQEGIHHLVTPHSITYTQPCINIHKAASVGTSRIYILVQSRLYSLLVLSRLRGVTVLLPGWVIWVLELSKQNSSPWAVGQCPYCQLPVGNKDTTPLHCYPFCVSQC